MLQSLGTSPQGIGPVRQQILAQHAHIFQYCGLSVILVRKKNYKKNTPIICTCVENIQIISLPRLLFICCILIILYRFQLVLYLRHSFKGFEHI